MLDLLADINGQPETLAANAPMLEAAYRAFRSMPAEPDHVITGMATSLWGWHAAGVTLRRAGRNPLIIDTSEYLRFGPHGSDRRPLIVTSRSGESVEIVRLLDGLAPDRRVIGLTASADSPLARRATESHCFMADEAAFYNTKSFTMTLAAASAIAGAMVGAPEMAPEHWVPVLAGRMREFLARDTRAARAIAEQLAGSRIALLTGRGYMIGLAKQAALDLQEGMKIGAIATPGGLLRHGPLELTRLADAMVLLLVPDDHVVSLMTTLGRDLVDAGARVGVIAGDGVDIPFPAPVMRVPRAAPELNPILFAVALQVLNVELAGRLGLAEIRPSLVPKVTSVE